MFLKYFAKDILTRFDKDLSLPTIRADIFNFIVKASPNSKES